MINLFNVSMDSVLIRVDLMGLIFLVASLSIEYSYLIFDLSPSSGSSIIQYYFITYVRSVAALVTCSSSYICRNVNLFDLVQWNWFIIFLLFILGLNTIKHL